MDAGGPWAYNAVEQGVEQICVRLLEAGPRLDARVGKLVDDSADEEKRQSVLMGRAARACVTCSTMAG